MPASIPASFRFPPAWLWLIDEAIPAYVKKHYSPRDSWKDKPFEKLDSQFFFKGIDELSEMFTEERPRDLPAYFLHPKFRSAYLLYFLPLQASKFLRLFSLHPQAARDALEHGKKRGKLLVYDLGAGPYTASIAFCLWALNEAAQTGEPLPPIEIHGWDHQRGILEDGKAILEDMGSQFPKLRDKLTVVSHPDAWWRAARSSTEPTSLILMGHVLNETPPRGEELPELPALSQLMGQMQGGGLLMVEPAAHRSSQHLSQIRDAILSSDQPGLSDTPLWGPCLHADKCPLAEGRDWCHFSLPIEIPGKWFKDFSHRLGSERQWVKFSYLWWAAAGSNIERPEAEMRRVISDPMKRPGEPTPVVLLCEPEHPIRYSLPSGKGVYRGDIIPYRVSRDLEQMKPARFRRKRD